MVEYALSLNSIFGSLADPTRRDILKRVSKKQLNVSEIAKNYDISFAGVAKHLKILEKARLIVKHRQGKQQIVQLSPMAIKDASEYLQRYKAMWEQRFDRLDELLKEEKNKFKH